MGSGSARRARIGSPPRRAALKQADGLPCRRPAARRPAGGREEQAGRAARRPSRGAVTHRAWLAEATEAAEQCVTVCSSVQQCAPRLSLAAPR